ncbi:MAG: hypothetical protein ACYTAF_01140 [Planctomycetota bacterium]
MRERFFVRGVYFFFSIRATSAFGMVIVPTSVSIRYVFPRSVTFPSIFPPFFRCTTSAEAVAARSRKRKTARFMMPPL